MKKTIKAGISSVLIFILVHTLVITIDGLVDDKSGNLKYVVVLGSKVNEDGTLSNRLKARLDRTIELGRDKIYFVSGGYGKEGYYEGTKMKEYLVSKGVNDTNIVVDNQGINTRATAINFRKKFPEIDSVILVSQYFHITRCKLAFKQIGIHNTVGLSPSYYEWRDLYALFREFFGFYAYLIRY